MKWLRHTFYLNILNTYYFFFQEIERWRERGEERGEREGRGGKRGERRRKRDGKILKEKQSQEISCFHKILYLAKISLEYPTKSNLLIILQNLNDFEYTKLFFKWWKFLIEYLKIF